MSDSAITKLNAENYDLWSYKLKFHLMRENLWDVVNNNIPTLPDAIWSEQNNKAMALIGLSIEDNQFIHIKKLSTANEYWKSLKTHHEKCNLSTRVMLFKKLCKMQLQRNEKMEDHINEMLTIIDKLSNMGLELHNSIVIALLLASLPSTYNNLITALETRPEEDLTIDLIKEKFLQEFSRRQNRESRDSDTCDFCKKPGHNKKNCHALQRKKNETKTKETEKGFEAMNLKSKSKRSNKS